MFWCNPIKRLYLSTSTSCSNYIFFQLQHFSILPSNLYSAFNLLRTFMNILLNFILKFVFYMTPFAKYNLPKYAHTGAYIFPIPILHNNDQSRQISMYSKEAKIYRIIPSEALLKWSRKESPFYGAHRIQSDGINRNILRYQFFSLWNCFFKKIYRLQWYYCQIFGYSFSQFIYIDKVFL